MSPVRHRVVATLFVSLSLLLSCNPMVDYYEFCFLLDECGYAVEEGFEGVDECTSKLEVVLDSGRYEGGSPEQNRQNLCEEQIEKCVSREPTCSELASSCTLDACEFFMN